QVANLTTWSFHCLVGLPRLLCHTTTRGSERRTRTAGVATCCRAGVRRAALGIRSYKRRNWQSTDGFRVERFQSVRNAEQEGTRLFGLAAHLNGEPTRFAGHENVGRQSVSRGRAQQRGIMAVLIGLHILRFHPQRSTGGLFLIEQECYSHGASQRSAASVG